MAEVLVNQPTAAPTPKVAAVGVAGAIAVLVPLIVTILATFNIIVPDDLANQIIAAGGALVTVYAAIQAAVQFAAGYFKRNTKKA